MKNPIKLLTLITTLLLLIFQSCKDDEEPVPQNVAPVMVAQSFSASEGASSGGVLGTVVATDPEGKALTFSITTNDNGLFEISTVGALSLATGKNLDFETAASHTITVAVSDGDLETEAAMTINVTDIDEAPSIAAQSFTVKEDVSGTDILGSIVATDPNGDNLTYTIDSKGSLTFALANVNDITLASGVTLDYEATKAYMFDVTVSDGTYSATAAMTVNVEDVNDERPEFTVFGPFSVAEDVNQATIIGTVVATDADSDELTYSIGTGGDLFEVSPNGGEISLRATANLDYETKTQHSLQITVFDGKFNVSVAVIVNVTDVVESAVTVSTFAGSITGSPGATDAIGLAAKFRNLGGVAHFNGAYYIADTGNHLIRKMSASGEITTFAGSSQGYLDGMGTAAKFNSPSGIAIDGTGNLYVTDSDNHRIRKITQNGEVTTFAGSGNADFEDGTGTKASFNSPKGICFDLNNNLYIADYQNNMIRMVTSSGEVSRYAGTTSGGYANGDRLLEANLNHPYDIIYNRFDKAFYFSDADNHVIRTIDNNTVRIYAGTPNQAGYAEGPTSTGMFDQPRHLAMYGQELLVVDYNNHAVRKVAEINISSPGSGFGLIRNEIINLAGGNGEGLSDGDATTAKFYYPSGICFDNVADGIFITEELGNRIRKIIIN
ncbi:cadherin domain-containing protein [Flammeovirgaceae bacterium SG7u.111]|nr:cadherin domain-containing protein [Flammeovirgaceae bacterium SG7u.132]WPO35728.1 cadherin domain-containing protein [Flammeovirgaceae bacterium SG7u.111]